jgi:hypothetical protein
MLYWAVKITIISIVLVILVHHLINFFKSTLTVPKIKDLVNKPSQKYENMYNIINNSNNNSNNNNNNSNDSNNKNQENDYTLIDLLPTKEENNMKDELKNFLKTQLKNSNFNDTNISPLHSNNDGNISYSSY